MYILFRSNFKHTCVPELFLYTILYVYLYTYFIRYEETVGNDTQVVPITNSNNNQNIEIF